MVFAQEKIQKMIFPEKPSLTPCVRASTRERATRERVTELFCVAMLFYLPQRAHSKVARPASFEQVRQSFPKRGCATK
jgi:hypothetical protein